MGATVLRALGFASLLVLAAAPTLAQAPRPPLPGDQTDGSRAHPVHRIPLRDTEGEVIRPTDRPLLPFSTQQTCGADCHDVETIGRGWHFTVTTPGSPGGRRGEPWILVDAETATQLPLSYHRWPGTFHPEQVGITPWMFARLFGGRTPGGLTGSEERRPDLRTRWAVSGELEVNCLACHDGSPAYDHAEYGRQIALENFRWAPSAASGLGLVSGAAREMPNTFDYLFPYVEDALLLRMPAVSYAPERFLPGAKSVFDIARGVPARRCYFCHSTVDLDHTAQGRWKADEDIHLARGMTCVDCHRNGLDHSMTRGYEEGPATDASAAALTCRGCHMASEPDRVFARGRLGAPYPRHAGLPPIHLEKLACTTCHSGPRPADTTRGLKTSQAHRLGGLNVNKDREALPHLFHPVFAREDDGTTRPNRLLWPAFWARLANGTVTPVPPDRVKALMSKARMTLPPSPRGTWPEIDEARMARILAILEGDPRAGGTAVYVAGGRLYRLAGGTVTAEDHPAARPYLWPLAHEVRPAAAALGAKGCQDCHDARSPIFFGHVPVDSPLRGSAPAPWPMHRFQKDLDPAYATSFGRTFAYRVWLKTGVSAGLGLLALLALAYLMPALGQLSAATAARRWTRVLANLVGLATFGAGVASGLPALLSARPLTGFPLMLHMAAAAAFTAGAVLVALFWAERNAFTRADWNRLRRPIGPRRSAASSYAVVSRKASFWLAVGAAIPAVASATLAMFPVLASVRQASLFLVHRYSVATLTIAGTLFACLALVAWLRGHETEDKAARVLSSV